MDSHRFDEVTSSFAQTRTRRDALRLFGLAAFGASGISLALTNTGEARKRRKRRRKNGIKHGSGSGNGTGGGNQDGTGGGDGSGGGNQHGTGGNQSSPTKQLREICSPAADTCAAGLQCGTPTTRHTCSSSIPGKESHWCCVPPGGRCTECDCCGNYYCAYDDNNVPMCVPNPEG